MESWQWLFVFFAVLMAVRIVPRYLRSRKANFQTNSHYSAPDKPVDTQTQPESPDRMVLGQITRGVNNFSGIQKKTWLESKELNSILSSLEKRGLIKVEQKKGLVGIKVEILPTKKGFNEYRS